MFKDKVKIHIKAGDGGNGKVSFAHDIFKPKGGPDGGDGGSGGNIYFEVDSNLNTLGYFTSHKNISAAGGENGRNHKQRGKSGQDLTVKIPLGTIVFNEDTSELLFDLVKSGQKVCIVKGGEGGFGNAHFISSTRQTPKVAELGEPGEEKDIRLELKLIADVGLIGLPNVGKSTLLSVISKARPKIADYPFTTLAPNLGVVEGVLGKKIKEKDFGFVVADIPGLIEGASKGKGLGDEFLRHVERTRILVHILDAQNENLFSDFKQINKELELYNPKLVKKPQIIVVNKIDLLNEKELKEKISDFKKKLSKSKILLESKDPILISAVAHKGVDKLLYKVSDVLKKIPKKLSDEKKKKEYKVFTIDDLVSKTDFVVEKKKNKFIVRGTKVEKFAVRTDFSNVYSIERLYDILKRLGVLSQLKRQGAKEGDVVIIKGKKLKFKE